MKLADMILNGRIDRTIMTAARTAQTVNMIRERCATDPEFAAKVAEIDTTGLIEWWNGEAYVHDRRAISRFAEILSSGPLHCPVIDVTGVHGAMKDRNPILPAMRPPFDHCWVEYALPYQDQGAPRTMRFGAMFWTQPWQETNIDGASDHCRRMWSELNVECGESARWSVIAMGGWGHNGSFLFARTFWIWALDEHGDALGFRGLHTGGIDEETDDGAVLAAFAFAFALMNCGNVDFVDHHAPDKLQRARRKRKQQPLISYRTLIIRPPGQRSMSPSSASDDGGEALRFHIRRGHFADYRHGPGLFGRPDLRRVFWFSPTLVGSKEAGEVRKDYAMATPEPARSVRVGEPPSAAPNGAQLLPTES